MKRVILIGAAGRDFHNFNVLFRDNAEYRVVAFTAAQIPYISDRLYPKELAGRLYENGIKIYDEKELPSLIKRLKADICVMSYSDLMNDTVMQKASIANAAGADFWLVAPEHTMLKSSKPVIAVCAARTGSGKTQTTKYLSSMIKQMGIRVVIVRHPMPYGILKEQKVQRYTRLSDLDRYKCTIEEREDYEPHIRNGITLYSGVDYAAILAMAEKEADVIIWDGGNNDTPFFKPDLLIAVTDPLRAGDEISYYPGETVVRMADIAIINKANSASAIQVKTVRRNIGILNPKARIVVADSIISVDNQGLINGRRVLVVEDGPTVTHGGMSFGAATLAAKQFKARSIVDVSRYAVGEIKRTIQRYPHLKKELPAVGYSKKEIRDLETTINTADCDSVVSATPINLSSVVNINKPVAQVSYELKPRGALLNNSVRKLLKERIGSV